jgi:hypothetical protein
VHYMFVRWQSRQRNRAVFGPYGKGDVRWRVVLVESARVNGKPRQRHICYLGSVTESAIKLLIQRCHFWDKVGERLDRLGNQITTADRDRIEAVISEKVPRPSPAEYKDAARDAARIIGWEFLTDRQRAALEDEADQLRDGEGTATANLKHALEKLQGGDPLRMCSFCGKAEDQVHTLVASNGAYICDGCVDVAAQLIASRRENETS